MNLYIVAAALAGSYQWTSGVPWFSFWCCRRQHNLLIHHRSRRLNDAQREALRPCSLSYEDTSGVLVCHQLHNNLQIEASVLFCRVPSTQKSQYFSGKAAALGLCARSGNSSSGPEKYQSFLHNLPEILPFSFFSNTHYYSFSPPLHRGIPF